MNRQYYGCMNTFLRKNFALVLAFGLPMLLIAAVALSTYLPGVFLSTHYNFVYTSCTDGVKYYPYSCDNYLQKRYGVVNGKLVRNSVNLSEDADKNGVPDFNTEYSDRIFLHDTKLNESREITLEEAQALTLNNLLTSPDGVTVSSGYTTRHGGFFLFDGGSSSYGYYLTKGRSRSKLQLINTTDQYYYQNNFQFLGWVLPGRTS